LGIDDLPRHVRIQRRAVLLVPQPHDYHLVHTRSDADRYDGIRARNHPLYTVGNLGACGCCMGFFGLGGRADQKSDSHRESGGEA
ncbi:MAG: hypothetical protein VW713_10405, partial [Alphaproteobacteria bacterium]